MFPETAQLQPAALMSVNDAWTSAKAELRARLSQHSFVTYVAVAIILPAARENSLRLGYPTGFIADFARDAYQAVFEETLLSVSNRKLSVEFVHAASTTEDAKQNPGRASSPTRVPVALSHTSIPVVEKPRTSVSAGLDPSWRFDTFEVGVANKLAYAAAQTVAQGGLAYNPFTLCGGVGLGKTHLMHAVGHAFAKAHPEQRVCCVTSEQFMNEFVLGIKKKQMEAVRRRFRECDLLLVDDIHFLAGRTATQEEFFHSLNALVTNGKQVVVTSEYLPQRIEKMDERLRSRLCGGLIVNLSLPGRETRIEILRARAQTMKLTLSDEVLKFLAANVRQDVRALVGTLNRLAAFSQLMGQPITVELCEEQLSGTFSPGNGEQLDLQGVIEACAVHFGVTAEQIKGPLRTRTILRARQATVHIACTQLCLSTPIIGAALGGRDHSTVISSRDRVPVLMEKEPKFSQSIKTLVNEVNNL